MFKMLNSKKGFTLVELMIVVVIMAILVAVAVPIYGAVTKSAQKRTCEGNRRQILAQVNNYVSGIATGIPVSGSVIFAISSNGDDGSVAASPTGVTADSITSWFQELPYCPAGGTISVAYGGAVNGAVGTIQVSCDFVDHG